MALRLDARAPSNMPGGGGMLACLSRCAARAGTDSSGPCLVLGATAPLVRTRSLHSQRGDVPGVAYASLAETAQDVVLVGHSHVALSFGLPCCKEVDCRRFWFNPTTGEVEEGMQSPWTDRMGPYATREEAVAALQEAQRRTESWDEADRRWKEWRD